MTGIALTLSLSGKQGGLQPFPRLSEILNIMLHCRKFLEKLQLIVVV